MSRITSTRVPQEWVERYARSDAFGAVVRDIAFDLLDAQATIASIRRFAAAHHAAEPAHVLLHALTVDIPDICAQGDARPVPPKITVFCGSSRFVAQMAVLMWEYEKAGRIAMGLHLLPADAARRPDGSVIEHHLAEEQGVAAQMDELHLRKIDLADEVFVVNVGGYIGDSTRREIAYAAACGKPVRFLEPIVRAQVNDGVDSSSGFGIES